MSFVVLSPISECTKKVNSYTDTMIQYQNPLSASVALIKKPVSWFAVQMRATRTFNRSKSSHSRNQKVIQSCKFTAHFSRAFMMYCCLGMDDQMRKILFTFWDLIQGELIKLENFFAVPTLVWWCRIGVSFCIGKFSQKSGKDVICSRSGLWMWNHALVAYRLNISCLTV